MNPMFVLVYATTPRCVPGIDSDGKRRCQSRRCGLLQQRRADPRESTCSSRLPTCATTRTTATCYPRAHHDAQILPAESRNVDLVIDRNARRLDATAGGLGRNRLNCRRRSSQIDQLDGVASLLRHHRDNLLPNSTQSCSERDLCPEPESMAAASG